jgi:transposase
MNQTNWVGVDTHKETLACYKDGKFKEFKTNKEGFESAVKWAGPESLWAVEGAYCFGRPFVAHLIKNGCEVYEVNPLLTKSWRKMLSISNPKNDYGDAKVISLNASKARLQKISLEAIELKEKITARNHFIKDRTSLINAIKMNYSSRGIKLPFNDLTTLKAGKWLSEQEDFTIKHYGKLLKELNESINDFDKEIAKSLPEKARRLMRKNGGLKGIAEISAAIIYAETKGKLISPEALASYAGVAPVENSSGKKKKHKNNKTGNRKLNSVFYRLSLHQSIHDPEGKKYYEKKLAEGKTKRHARKCLARRLVDIIFKMLND